MASQLLQSEIPRLGRRRTRRGARPFPDALDSPPDSPKGGLQPLLDLVADDMRAVNRIILDKAVSDVELMPELARHLIDSGGKRLRPMLTIARRHAVRLSGRAAT